MNRLQSVDSFQFNHNLLSNNKISSKSTPYLHALIDHGNCFLTLKKKPTRSHFVGETFFIS